MQLVLTNLLVPGEPAHPERTRSAEISQNVTARFLNRRAVHAPGEGITLYIREISATGEF